MTALEVLCRAETEVAKHQPERPANWALLLTSHPAWALPAIEIMQALPRGSRVLDLGCGRGVLATAAYLLGHEVVAVDRFVEPPAMDGIGWLRGDVQDPAFLRDLAPFDLVIMTEVLEHLQFDPRPLLRRIRDEWLCERGTFVGSTPEARRWPAGDPPLHRPGDPLPEWTPEAAPLDAHVKLYYVEQVEALLLLSRFAARDLRYVDDYRLWWEAVPA